LSVTKLNIAIQRPIGRKYSSCSKRRPKAKTKQTEAGKRKVCWKSILTTEGIP